ncbi:MAG: hypothetical protein ACF8XB_20420, partial [Planctomycetota bacterium JB042]
LEGLDVRAPLGAVWIDGKAGLVRVPFVGSADEAGVRRAAPSGGRVVRVAGRRSFVLAPDVEAGRVVAEYLARSAFVASADGALLSFRFAAAPFVARAETWLAVRADLLRGVDRVASVFGDGRPDLRRVADGLEDARSILAPWELVDGEVRLGGDGIVLRGRLAARPGSETARWLDRESSLPPVVPERRSGVALLAEWRAGPSDGVRWEGVVRDLAGRLGGRFERTPFGGRMTVARPGCSLAPGSVGDDGSLFRLSVACDALRGDESRGAPLHFHVARDGRELLVELSAPIGQLRACVPVIEVR